MANETQKPDGGKKAVWLWTIAAIIVLLVLFVWWKVPKPTFAGSKSAETTTEQPYFSGFSPGRNSITITKKWSKRMYNDPQFFKDKGQPVEKNTAWQVMYDDDPVKTYTFQPANTPGTGDFPYTNTWTFQRLRILPSQQKATSEYVFLWNPR